MDWFALGDVNYQLSLVYDKLSWKLSRESTGLDNFHVVGAQYGGPIATAPIMR